MTDKQLRDAAVAELKLTTVGWSKVKSYSPEKLASTHWGKAMTLLAQIGQTAGASSLLTWAPPALYPVGANRVDWTMTNANRQDTALVNGNNRDLVITCNEALTGPVYQIGGGGGGPWRNVVWIGGKITHTPGSGDNYALPIAATGTVHLEGLDIACDGDAIMSRGGGPSCVWQIQNCRVAVHFLGNPREHSDCFQFQGGTKIDKLRFARCTMITDYQGFMLRFPDSAAYCNSGDFRQLNFRRLVAGQDPSQAYIFIPDEDTAMGHPPNPPMGPISMNDVWIEHNTSKTSAIYPDKIFSDAFTGGGAYVNRYGIFQLSDATSTYYRASTPSDVVPPGGAASGQSCFGPSFTGIVRVGVPTGGDYCPSGTPGMSYVSPGYA